MNAVDLLNGARFMFGGVRFRARGTIVGPGRMCEPAGYIFCILANANCLRQTVRISCVAIDALLESTEKVEQFAATLHHARCVRVWLRTCTNVTCLATKAT